MKRYKLSTHSDAMGFNRTIVTEDPDGEWVKWEDVMITQKEVLRYEIAASWWACWISGNYLQAVIARYFARKVKRKYARYNRHVEFSKYSHMFKRL